MALAQTVVSAELASAFAHYKLDPLLERQVSIAINDPARELGQGEGMGIFLKAVVGDEKNQCIIGADGLGDKRGKRRRTCAAEKSFIR